MTESLPREILIRVSKYLQSGEAMDLASTCSTIRHGLDLGPIDDIFSHDLSDQSWDEHNTGHVGNYMLWFRFMPLFLQSYIHTVQFECEFQDQGWGNRKGKISIFEVESDSLKTMASSPTAEHHETNLKLEFQPQPGKNYAIHYRVGGGGGHRLLVRKPRIRTLIYGRQMGIVLRAFQVKSLIPHIRNTFVAKMMIVNLDLLIGSIGRNEDQDEGVSSLFVEMGFDTQNIEVLNSIRKFLDEVTKWQEVNERKRTDVM